MIKTNKVLGEIYREGDDDVKDDIAVYLGYSMCRARASWARAAYRPSPGPICTLRPPLYFRPHVKTSAIKSQ